MQRLCVEFPVEGPGADDGRDPRVPRPAGKPAVDVHVVVPGHQPAPPPPLSPPVQRVQAGQVPVERQLESLLGPLTAPRPHPHGVRRLPWL